MNDNIDNKVVYLRLDDIIPNRFQPREVFDETGLEELADSIKEHGIIQPIIVRQVGDKYELIAGERRSKASAMAGLTTIPAIIRNMDDKESAKVSLLENLQRKNLSAIEEARTYKRILELDNLTQEDLARTMGKSQPMIANKLRLLSLPEEVQDALIKNQISERHARSLLNVKDKENQLHFLDRIRNERLTVRELDVEIKKYNQPEETTLNNETNSGIGQFNNFNPQEDYKLPNQVNMNNDDNNFSNNYQLNYNSMGLNDYQTSISNNMFNNIPTNYETNSTDNNSNNYNYDSFDSNINEVTNSNDLTSNISDSSSNISDTNINSEKMSFSNDNIFNTPNVTPNSSSLDTNNQNIFISHIKEDGMSSENKFLPNFINENNDKSSEYQFNQVNNGYSDFSSLNTSPLVNNLEKNDNKLDMGNPLSFNNNQGTLFNQPLNIVETPINDYTYLEQPTTQEETYSDENFRFDNPLDDKYEDILFAKPVPINDSFLNNNETVSSNQQIEVENNEDITKEDTTENVNNSNQYISLEPERTIFNAHDSIMELKKTTDRIKENNINIDTEEIDFDDYYQIIIKIKK